MISNENVKEAWNMTAYIFSDFFTTMTRILFSEILVFPVGLSITLNPHTQKQSYRMDPLGQTRCVYPQDQTAFSYNVCDFPVTYFSQKCNLDIVSLSVCNIRAYKVNS